MKSLLFVLLVLYQLAYTQPGYLPKYQGAATSEVGGVTFMLPSQAAGVLCAPLDGLGRPRGAFAVLGLETLSSTEREGITSITPPGFVQANYQFISGVNLYHRCHLIAHQLGGSEIPENLVTGTQYLNIAGMVPIENRVAEYILQSGNHVRYQVIPVYADPSSLVCSGVIILAESVEDDALRFSVYCHNVQPGVSIDYRSGKSRLASVIALIEAEDEETRPGSLSVTYILNVNTKRFHLPECASVSEAKPKNIREYYGDRESLITAGYKPCGRCDP